MDRDYNITGINIVKGEINIELYVCVVDFVLVTKIDMKTT